MLVAVLLQSGVDPACVARFLDIMSVQRINIFDDSEVNLIHNQADG